MRLPHFAMMPEIVQHTDLAVIFPRHIVPCFNHNKAFRILPLSFFLPPIGIQLHSHLQFAAASIAWRIDAIDAIDDMFHQPSAGTETRRL